MNNAKTENILLLSGKSKLDCLAQVNFAKALFNDGISDEKVAEMVTAKENLSAVRGFVTYSDQADFFSQTKKDMIKYLDFADSISYGKKSVFLFPGHGIYQKNMLNLLCEVHPFFQKRLTEIEQIAKQHYEISILAEEQEDFVVKQLRMFASELVIAEFWEACGCQADYSIGHSFGEYPEACFAGVLSVSDAIFMLVKRSNILQEKSDYQMAAAETSLENLTRIAQKAAVTFEISGYNAPEIITITAKKTAMEKLGAACKSEKIQLNLINKEGGGHFSGLSEKAEQYYQEIQQISFQNAKRTLLSTVYPDGNQNFISAAYWRDHICRPVHFQQAVHNIPIEIVGRIIDVGVSPVLLGMAMKNIGNQKIQWIPSVRAGRNYKKQIYRALGLAYNSGAEIHLM